MRKLNKNISELLYTHISIYDKIEQNTFPNGDCVSQLDFLCFWVDPEKYKNHCPFEFNDLRDNPNWEVTQYDNVYQMVENDKIVLQYVKEGYTPVAILQRYKFKNKQCDGRKISIYGKGLRLYYMGLIDWLPDYVEMYYGDMVRADLCWDFKEKLPDGIVDLPLTVTYGKNKDFSYMGYGNKNSPLFIRIYDKTLDLKKDKNSMAWLYPERYTQQCWRLECKFTGRYANCYTPLERLGVCEKTGFIKRVESQKKDFLKSTFYNLIMYVSYLPNKKQQYDLLSSVRDCISNKLSHLKDHVEEKDD